MSKCDVCINKKYCANNLDARIMCPQMDYVLFTPSYKTNYDLLISKTPEEMAEWLVSTMTCTACHDMHGGKCPKPKDYKEKKCRDMILDWLKSPVEVDNANNE